MKDHIKFNLILIVAFLPFCVAIFWCFIFGFTMIRPLSFWEILFLILSYLFAILVYVFHPRYRHWRKAMSEFEENYRYEEAAE